MINISTHFKQDKFANTYSLNLCLKFQLDLDLVCPEIYEYSDFTFVVVDLVIFKLFCLKFGSSRIFNIHTVIDSE